jgi:hypothetical protein
MKPTRIDRRSFLKGSGALLSLAGAASTYRHFNSPETDVLRASGINAVSRRSPGGATVTVFNETDGAVVDVFDITTGAHTIDISLSDRGLILAIPKHEVAGTLYRRAEFRAEAFPALEGCRFYGHSVALEESGVLAMAEYDTQSLKGRITLREFDTFKVTSVIESNNESPHDLALLADDTLAVLFDGGVELKPGRAKSCVSAVETFDVANGARRRVEEFKPGVVLSHFLRVGDDEYVLAGFDAHQLCPTFGVWNSSSSQGVVFRQLARSDGRPSDPKEKILSLALGSQGLVAATVPSGNRVVVFSPTEGRIHADVHVHSPLGVTALEDGRFLVSSEFSGFFIVERVSRAEGSLFEARAVFGGPTPSNSIRQIQSAHLYQATYSRLG